jgi:hypothetical protein
VSKHEADPALWAILQEDIGHAHFSLKRLEADERRRFPGYDPRPTGDDFRRARESLVRALGQYDDSVAALIDGRLGDAVAARARGGRWVEHAALLIRDLPRARQRQQVGDHLRAISASGGRARGLTKAKRNEEIVAFVRVLKDTGLTASEIEKRTASEFRLAPRSIKRILGQRHQEARATDSKP